MVHTADRAAEQLRLTAETGTPCPPVRSLIGSTAVGPSYAVQSQLVQRRLAAGARVVGRKIGLTSPAVQKQLGVDQPDFGVLFADMEGPAGSVVGAHRLLQPKIEAEVAFVLTADLDDGRLDDPQIRAAVGYACAALEIVDSRMDAAYRTLLEPHELTYPQYAVVSVLRQHGPTPVTGIGRLVGVSTNTVSPLLKRLERQGWVSRRRSEQDERTVVAALTTQGQRLSDELQDVPQRINAATGLSELEQTDLVDRLHQLSSALREHGTQKP